MALWTKEERKLLGLSVKEHKLLDTLYKKGTLNTLVLAFEAKIPRVTTMRLLKTLRGRGFVSRQTLLNEVRWSLTKPEVQVQKFLRAFEETQNFSTKNALSLSDVASISVFRGQQEMFESNKKLLVAHAGERLYSIEPSGIWKHVMQIPARDWTHLNSLLMQKKIVIEAVVEEDFEAQMQKFIDPVYAKSFIALSNELHVLPKGFLNSSTEVVIFRDQAYFLDWEQLVGVEIKNPSTIKLLKGVFELLKRSATRI